MIIYIDADACPVKNEIIKTASRHKIRVFVVSNGGIRLNPNPLVETIIVETGLDVADKWILNRLENSDIVVTYDIPLASDSIKLGAFVMTPYGKELNPSNIGSTLATRNLMHEIRSANQFLENKNTTFSKKNRSEFSNNLEKLIQKLKKNHINV